MPLTDSTPVKMGDSLLVILKVSPVTGMDHAFVLGSIWGICFTSLVMGSSCFIALFMLFFSYLLLDGLFGGFWGGGF